MKKRMLASLAVLGASALVAVAAVATAAWTGESTAAAKENFCDSLVELADTVTSYQGLDPLTATNDELESAAADVDDAWDDVVDEAYDWAYADDNALTEAYDDLYEAIEELPGDNTASDNLEALEPYFAALPGAYVETFDGSGCSSE